ncbi:Uncharacterised protein [uncultured archaeon]|nr:Uncharacterised protein [uncultured archaeon]
MTNQFRPENRITPLVKTYLGPKGYKLTRIQDTFHLTVNLNGELYAVIFNEDQKKDALSALGRMAQNPELEDFGWPENARCNGLIHKYVRSKV